MLFGQRVDGAHAELTQVLTSCAIATVPPTVGREAGSVPAAARAAGVNSSAVLATRKTQFVPQRRPCCTDATLGDEVPIQPPPMDDPSQASYAARGDRAPTIARRAPRGDFAGLG